MTEETGCEKVNIIAHSKGGLDSRYAISRLGMDQYTASLTTINSHITAAGLWIMPALQYDPSAGERVLTVKMDHLDETVVNALGLW